MGGSFPVGLLRLASLAIVLFLFWLAMSGHYKPYLLVLGVACALFTVYVAVRMKLGDHETHPINLLLGAITYWPWLAWEILKSGWTVTRIILSPSLPISPTLTRVRASQKSAPGIATYGNSITLTPGTITTKVRGNVLTVHALTKAGAIDLEDGGMDKRVTRFEGSQ